MWMHGKRLTQGRFAATAVGLLALTACGTAPQLSTAPAPQALAAEFKSAGTAFAPPGAKTALVSCAVYSTVIRSETPTHVRVAAASGGNLEWLASEFCPHVTKALYDRVGYSWTPEEEVFAHPWVAKCSARSGAGEHVRAGLRAITDIDYCPGQLGSVKPHAGYGYFGVVSRGPCCGPLNPTQWFSGKKARTGPALPTEVRELAHQMQKDMVFIATIMVTPRGGSDWDLERVEIAGFRARQRPKASMSISSPLDLITGGFKPFSNADAALRWQGRYRFTSDTGGIDKFAEAMTSAINRHLADAQASGGASQP